MAVDTVQRRVQAIIVDGAVRAYAFRLPSEPPYDPELCVCQRLRPEPDADVCRRCIEEAS